MRLLHTQFKVSCSILQQEVMTNMTFLFVASQYCYLPYDTFQLPHKKCSYKYKTVICCLDKKSSFLVVGPSKRGSGTLLPLSSANVSALCPVPASAGAGPRLAPHALGLWKLPHVHMLRMVQAQAPIFHHLPAPCIYTQRQGLHWIATATLHLVGAEKFWMLTCRLQE